MNAKLTERDNARIQMIHYTESKSIISAVIFQFGILLSAIQCDSLIKLFKIQIFNLINKIDKILLNNIFWFEFLVSYRFNSFENIFIRLVLRLIKHKF